MGFDRTAAHPDAHRHPFPCTAVMFRLVRNTPRRRPGCTHPMFPFCYATMTNPLCRGITDNGYAVRYLFELRAANASIEDYRGPRQALIPRRLPQQAHVEQASGGGSAHFGPRLRTLRAAPSGRPGGSSPPRTNHVLRNALTLKDAPRPTVETQCGRNPRRVDGCTRKSLKRDRKLKPAR